MQELASGRGAVLESVPAWAKGSDSAAADPVASGVDLEAEGPRLPSSSRWWRARRRCPCRPG